MQLWVGMDLRRVVHGFLEHVEQEEQGARVVDFATAVDVMVAIMDVEENLCGGG